MTRPPTSLLDRSIALSDVFDGKIEGQQAIRVDLDLILFYESTDAGHFGDPVDRRQFISEIPVLDRAELARGPAPRGPAAYHPAGKCRAL